MVVFAFGDKKVTVPTEVIQSEFIIHYLKDNPNAEVTLPERFDHVIENYTDFLNGDSLQISSVENVKLCLEMANFVIDKNYFSRVMQQTYKVWDTFQPLILTLTENVQREVYLFIPYSYVPKSLMEVTTFRNAWIDNNKGKIITLNVGEEYHTEVSYHPNGKKQRLYIYQLVNNNKNREWEVKWHTSGIQVVNVLMNSSSLMVRRTESVGNGIQRENQISCLTVV